MPKGVTVDRILSRKEKAKEKNDMRWNAARLSEKHGYCTTCNHHTNVRKGLDGKLRCRRHHT